MTPIKCPNCRLSLPQSWTGMNDPNAKCPYCGKLLSGKPGGATQAGQAPDPPPAPAAPQAASRGAAAKTILWGVGAPIPGLPRPGADQAAAPVARPVAPMTPTDSGPKPVEPARPAAVGSAPGLSTAATIARSVADVPQLSGGMQRQPVGGADDASLGVNVSDSRDPESSNSKPAPTVMFDGASGLGPGPDLAAPPVPAQREESSPEPADDDDSASRPVKSKPKGRQPLKKGRRTPAKWGSAGADEEEEAKPAATSSKMGLIIGVSAAALVVLAVIVGLALRGGKKADDPSAGEPAKPAPEQAQPKAEPTTDEAQPALAAKPTQETDKPVEQAKPAEKPASLEKTPRADKPAADKPVRAEKPAREERAPAEKPQPAEKSRPALADEGEAKAGNKPSEADYKAANAAYQRGNEKLFKGNTTGAIKDFSEALRLNPRDPAIHRGLGLAYAQSGKSAEAVKHLKAYLKAAPKANDRAMVEKRIDQLQRR